MFSWFERRLDPFPSEEPQEPPRTLVAFCLHYTRGAWPWLTASAILMALIAVAEVWLFGFMGDIVNWLSQQSRETFWTTQRWPLLGMAAVVPARPVMTFMHSLRNHQTLLGD